MTLLVGSELGFARETIYLGGWYSFFSAPPINQLYGDLTLALAGQRCVHSLEGAWPLARFLATARRPARG